ncbi:Hypothetical protein D9617_1g079370 [Elsinoe fawcettii]|nr:Hypothetical protein D9617_1g079370 [Elsinoe fawcettii]
MYHVDATLISDLWQLQTEWVKQLGWDTFYPRWLVFERFILDVIV